MKLKLSKGKLGYEIRKGLNMSPLGVTTSLPNSSAKGANEWCTLIWLVNIEGTLTDWT